MRSILRVLTNNSPFFLVKRGKPGKACAVFAFNYVMFSFLRAAYKAGK